MMGASGAELLRGQRLRSALSKPTHKDMRIGMIHTPYKSPRCRIMRIGVLHAPYKSAQLPAWGTARLPGERRAVGGMTKSQGTS